MGRPPCCDKAAGVKKGPWTPEEDLVLVSYVQENGPGNWRAVPAKTGLMRCSKSCRLRWTNYLRPGIRRGGFSEQEDRLIVHLQALLGNRWAAIASYLPDRTDNDVKNYWNTHLKKKLPLQQQQKPTPQQQRDGLFSSPAASAPPQPSNKGKWELRLQTDIDLARRALRDALSVDSATRPCPPPGTIKQSPAAVPSDEPAAVHAAPRPPYVGLSARNVSVMLDGWAPPPRAAQSASGSSPEHTDCSASAAGGSASSASDWIGGGSLLSRCDVAVKQDDDVPLSAIESWLLGDVPLLGDDGGEQLQQLLAAHQGGMLLDAAALHSFAF